MKLLIPILLVSLCCSASFAQQVDASVLVSPFEDEIQVLISATEESLDRWKDQKDPNLVAFPVELDIDILQTPATLGAVGGHRMSVLVEYSASAVQGVLAILNKDDLTVSKIQLKRGQSRVLLDLPADANKVKYVAPVIMPGAVVHITKVYLEPFQEQQRDFGFGTSEVCHPNVACESYTQYSDQVRSAVRMRLVLEEGIGWCTGTLINNTAMDGTPYILSAEHCLAQYSPMFDLWRFDFNYQSVDCDNPSGEPKFDSMTGCMLRAKERDTDFMLLELTDEVPVRYDVYYSGWDRSKDLDPGQVVLLHHPSGDIKKISRDRNTTFIWDKAIEWNEGYSTPINTHWRSRLDEGAFEGGSSGGGLFTQDGYLIGQLHGGSGDCTSNTAYSGAFSESWDYGSTNGRLKDWLDPLFEETVKLDGMNHPDRGNVYNLQGMIVDPNGNPAKGVRISINGPENTLFEVDSTGTFSLAALPKTDTLFITARKNSDPTNGVSASDLLLIKQHLLGTKPFEFAYQEIAADATGNGEISAGDILILQKLLLGLVNDLPSKPSWEFFPSEIRIVNPTDSVVQVQFTAIKMGDVNGTADPQQ